MFFLDSCFYEQLFTFRIFAVYFSPALKNNSTRFLRGDLRLGPRPVLILPGFNPRPRAGGDRQPLKALCTKVLEALFRERTFFLSLLTVHEHG